MNLIILGIDPGTVITGYGLIQMTEKHVQCLDYGVISSKEKSFHSRFEVLHQKLAKLCQSYKPHHVAVEKVFFGKNADTAFKLGHISALCLLESKKQGMEFFEYPSRFVKKSVTFSGNASKELVQKFVQDSLSLSEIKVLDASDALAVALCHSREYKKKLLLKKMQAKPSTLNS